MLGEFVLKISTAHVRALSISLFNTVYCHIKAVKEKVNCSCLNCSSLYLAACDIFTDGWWQVCRWQECQGNGQRWCRVLSLQELPVRGDNSACRYSLFECAAVILSFSKYRGQYEMVWQYLLHFSAKFNFPLHNPLPQVSSGSAQFLYFAFLVYPFPLLYPVSLKLSMVNEKPCSS